MAISPKSARQNATSPVPGDEAPPKKRWIRWVLMSPVAPIGQIKTAVTTLSISKAGGTGIEIKRGDMVRENFSKFRGAWGIGSVKAVPRRESFDEAMRRSGLDKVGLEQRAQQITWVSRSYYLCAFALFVFSLFQLNSLFGALATLALTVMCASKGWGAAFRLWQIGERRLGSIREFSKKPEAWIA